MFKKRNKVPSNGRSLPTGIKFKASSRLKTPPRYQRIELIQELPSTHVGPIWTMKFSSCGKLLATGGQDKVLRIWCLNSARDEFIVLKEKYKKNNTRGDGDITPNEEITVDRGECVISKLQWNLPYPRLVWIRKICRIRKLKCIVKRSFVYRDQIPLY